MQLGYIIIYVPNVEATMAFYKKAFCLEFGFLDESKKYGELCTGETKLAFVAEELSKANGVSFLPNRKENIAAGFEIALTTKEIEKAYLRAIEAGATPVKEPEAKPWGQKVAYVRDLNGVLVEICTPMS